MSSLQRIHAITHLVGNKIYQFIQTPAGIEEHIEITDPDASLQGEFYQFVNGGAEK